MAAPAGNKFAEGNPGGGRPTEYEERYAEMAYNICLLGSTDAELARILDVSEVTINNWKKQHEDFSLALSRGKDLADAEVARALYKRAVGYEYEETTVELEEKGETVTKKVKKHMPPDGRSAEFWLKNRKSRLWRDKQEIGLVDNEGNSVLITPVIQVFNQAPPMASSEGDIGE